MLELIEGGIADNTNILQQQDCTIFFKYKCESKTDCEYFDDIESAEKWNVQNNGLKIKLVKVIL